MSLFKKPYEISLWDDRLTLVGLDGKEYVGAMPDNIEIQTSYYKEIKICVIGSNEMDTPIRAFEPKLVRNVNGTNTLTFSIYAKYYDEESGNLLDNPFIPYLSNERKLKLKYLSKGKWEWLDFVIKKVNEDSTNYVFSYTAQDLFVHELSKNGYSLVFDAELNNNQGTVNELAGSILAGTDWQVGEDTEVIQQLVEEPLYEIKLSSDISAKDIKNNEAIVIKAGQTIYGFYSQIVEKENSFFQFIYNQNGVYTKDENFVLTNANVYYLPKGQPSWVDDIPSFAEEISYVNEFRGERYVKQQKTVYDPIIGQYVKIYAYEDKEVRGYSEYEYLTPETSKNLITNSNKFVSTSGWKAKETENIIPYYDENTRTNFLKISTDNKDSVSLTVLNSGFYDYASDFSPIKENDEFAFAIKFSYSNENLLAPTVSITSKSDEGNLNFNSINLDETLKNYYESLGYILYQGKYSLPWSQKTFAEIKHFVEMTFPIDNMDDYVLIEDVQLFKIVTQELDGKIYYRLPNGLTLENGIVVEDGWKAIAEENKFFYYFDENIKSKDQLVFLDPEKTYKPVYQKDYEKIRSISASESNRFNLLQNLSENFECWCRFDIKHKDTGEILLGKDLSETIISGGTASTVLDNVDMYDAGDSTKNLSNTDIYNGGSSRIGALTLEHEKYRQQKFITFHKRIGQEQHAGFRYGINLKGIKRTLDSDELATKLIVKNNTNEFAENGSCNISIASNNPSGENFILDFSYFIKRGLLNYENFYRELYSENESRGWIGYFTRLKRLNLKKQDWIIERESIKNIFQKVDSELQTLKVQVDTTSDELSRQKASFYERTSIPYDKIENDNAWLEQDEIKGLYEDIKRLDIHLEGLKSGKTRLQDSYLKLDKKIKELDSLIEDNKAKRENLIETFEKKYSRFIQEAGWISENHKDNELYYIDAESTLHKASQPKVSYNIDVVALAALEEYEGYDFDLGDITFVQDTEFFGWTEKNGVKVPYREQIVVTETTTNFDFPEKDSIKVQNYRTQFEDLFQRIAASTQKLEFYSGAYDRAADVIDTKGAVLPEALADAFANNSHILRNVKNQSIIWDENGLTATDTTNPAEIVRLVSGGLFVTDDGGETWSAGVTGKGINARVVTTGELNTDKVTIMSNGKPAFRWDKEGLNAYASDEEGKLTSKKYTRFNSDGIVGKNEGVDRFKLDWNGLQIRNQNNQEVFKADDDGDLTITGTIKAKNGNIGNWEIEEDGLSYTEEGKTEPSYYLGPAGKIFDEKGPYVFKAGDKFGVTPEGEVHATDALVSGTITAEEGSIGGISINPDGIRSSEAPEAPYVSEARYNINRVQGTKTADIANFGSVENTWYNYHFDVSQLEGYIITATGLTSKAQSDGHTYQVEFYFLEDKPTENKKSFPYLARAKTNVTYPDDGIVKWTVPNKAKYLLINQSVPFNDEEQIKKAVEIESRGFELTKEGKLKAEAGSIGGFEITNEGIKTKDISLTERGLSLGKSSALIDGSAHFVEVGLEDDYGNVVGQLKPTQVEYAEPRYYGATANIITNGDQASVIINVTDELITNKLFKVYITEKSGNKQMIAVSVLAGTSSGSAEIPGKNISIASYSPTYFNFEQKNSTSIQAVEMTGKFQLTLPENNKDDYTNDILLKQGTSVTSLIKRLLALESAVAELGINITPETIDL